MIPRLQIKKAARVTILITAIIIEGTKSCIYLRASSVMHIYTVCYYNVLSYTQAIEQFISVCSIRSLYQWDTHHRAVGSKAYSHTMHRQHGIGQGNC